MDMLIAFLSTLVGGVITWAVSRAYYVRASKDLSAEANNLKQLTTLMLRGMEEAGLAKFSRDEKGNIQGLVFDLSISESVHATDSTTVEISSDSSTK
jgi:hypothetical protein